MRVDDRPIPDFDPDTPDLLPWPAELHLLFEAESLAEAWDAAGIYWDDPAVKWDQPNLPGEMVDVSCDLAGVDIEHGPADMLELFPAGSMAATLIDPDGRYTRYRPDGTLIRWRIGKRVAVLCKLVGEWTWLFFGRITSWSDNADGSVEVVAFNLPHEMTSVGKFTAGTNGDNVAQRIAAIRPFTGAVDVVQRVAAGDVTLTAQETDLTPWEEMQRSSSLSDGGLLFADADDALVYFDRRWRTGRADQETVWTLSDNDCAESDAVVWNARLLTSDEELTTAVRLVNVAELEAVALLTPNPYGVDQWMVHAVPDLWTTQTEGDSLADWFLHHRSEVLVDVDELQIYADDARQPNLFPIVVDVRIGDLFTFRHLYRATDGTSTWFEIGAVVNLIRHSINPHEWVTTLGSWTQKLATVGRWNSGEWNRDHWSTSPGWDAMEWDGGMFS